MQRVDLPRETHLVATACNPCMDLVALLCRDNVSAHAAAGPPGLSAAQLAMRQKMLAFQARRMGIANPASRVAGGANVRSGPSIKLMLWRTGANSSQVWESPVAPPPDLFPAPSTAGDEHLSVAAVAGSPDGTCAHMFD